MTDAATPPPTRRSARRSTGRSRQLLHEEVPVIFIYWEKAFPAVAPNVGGFWPSPFNYLMWNANELVLDVVLMPARRERVVRPTPRTLGPSDRLPHPPPAGGYPLLLGVAVLSFIFMQLAPGGPDALFARNARMTEEQLQAIRHNMGLDRPLHEQL